MKNAEYRSDHVMKQNSHCVCVQESSNKTDKTRWTIETETPPLTWLTWSMTHMQLTTLILEGAVSLRLLVFQKDLN